MPCISYASKLEMEGDTAVVSREIEGGTEVVEVSAPSVISAAKGLAEQRIPNMRGIMMAKRKPLEVVPPIEADEPVRIAAYALPPEKGAVKMIDPDQIDQLVTLLHEEAKVI